MNLAGRITVLLGVSQELSLPLESSGSPELLATVLSPTRTGLAEKGANAEGGDVWRYRQTADDGIPWMQPCLKPITQCFSVT